MSGAPESEVESWAVGMVGGTPGGVTQGWWCPQGPDVV